MFSGKLALSIIWVSGIVWFFYSESPLFKAFYTSEILICSSETPLQQWSNSSTRLCGRRRFAFTPFHLLLIEWPISNIKNSGSQMIENGIYFKLIVFAFEVIDFNGSNLTPEANQLGAQFLPIINQ